MSSNKGFVHPDVKRQLIMEKKTPRMGKNCKCADCLYYDCWEEVTMHTCCAFPNGIPNSIISGETQHDRLIGTEVMLQTFTPNDRESVPSPDY